VNFNDSDGLFGCAVDGIPCDFYADYLQLVCPPGVGGCAVGSGANSPTDPGFLDRGSLLKFSKQLQNAVKNRQESDCQALADFADAAAQGGATAQQFKADLAILTPNQFPVYLIPGVQGSGGMNLTILNNVGATSGFATAFQDGYGTSAGPNNQDQAHHFAAFFQLGFSYGPGVGAAAADWWEKLEGTAGNLGDIALGTVAAALGADVEAGVLKPSDIGGIIRQAICK